ncbi:uncharacterized protein LOC113516731 [Galleria mellonella]|uniref:Uncharacterized protein LOC113516731 n=1 Tax=Galleria mellonella TaxID=7137 RepID=A0ABM3N301_GALME|nr:uncharacterized protein LOC113516731 [Galleria mellonella]
MRRKSDRNASKKLKSSPEKKVEKVKRTRSRRRKSTSSENESAEETIAQESEPVVNTDLEKKTLQATVKADSPEEAQDQVWHVKATESGDMGEIQKLKICLTRPSSTPERVDRSPRSKRKHSRATSSSDTPSIEGVDDRKKSKHRTKRATRESKDGSEKNHDSQEEQDREVDAVYADGDTQVTQSTEKIQDTVLDEIPMSTTSDDPKINDNLNDANEIQKEEMKIDVEQSKPSDADTTVVSPRAEPTAVVALVTETVMGSQEIETTVVSAKIDIKDSEDKISEKDSSESNLSMSIDKSEVLEIHAEESKCESSDNEMKTREVSVEKAVDEDKELICEKVSKIEEQNSSLTKDAESVHQEDNKDTNQSDVVEKSDTMDIERIRKNSSDAGDKVESSEVRHKSRDIEHSDLIQSTHEEIVQNGAAAPITFNRKRRWGSRPSKVTTQKSITISTDVLKEIIPDVKPVEFAEVIEEKKNKREVSEKVDRPVLPKIIIDNTENLEHNRKVKENDESDKDRSRDSHLASNRKISIVKDNDSIIARPPSPPRHKQSNILYITNLVRPFTLPQLKNLLQRTGRIEENGFWIDRIKSKCFVKYGTEDEAVETRHALHGVTWPVSNPKTLQVDFSTQEAFDKAKLNEETDNNQTSTIPGTVEDWLREQDIKRERGELEKPWERKAAMREWDLGKGEKDKEKDKLRKDDRLPDKRRHRSLERSPEPARKFKKKEEEAPAKLLDDLFRKTKTTPCIYWLPLSAETIAVKEEQRRQHMAEHERRFSPLYISGIKSLPLLDNDRLVCRNVVWDTRWYVLAVLAATAAAQDPFTLREFVNGNFAQRGFNGTWISDTEFTYTISGEDGIYLFNVETLNSTDLVDPELLKLLNTTRPVLSADRNYILAASEVQGVYRYSTTAKYTLYNIETNDIFEIAGHQRLQLCIFGRGHSLAYVLNNTLYYLPENSINPIKLTDDGIDGVIYNGHTDWVYEEDVMYTGQATWFSTNGSYLAFASFNDTEVETYSYYHYTGTSDPDDLYPELYHLKYPKVGRVNPSVSLYVVDLNSLVEDNNLNFLRLNAPEEVTEDHILGGVTWPTDNEIAVHWLNRRQNYTILRIYNVLNISDYVDERRAEPNGWVPIALPQFSSDGSYYVSTRWSHPQIDGRIWQHLYLSLRIGNKIESSSITPGLATVNSFVGVNEDGPYFYYTRTVPGSQWRSELRRGGARDGCISCNIQLPEGGPCTWVTATASRGGRYLSVTCSSPNEPSATYIVDPLQTSVTNAILYVWETNSIVRERLVEKSRPESVIFTVPLENGIQAPVRLHIPPGVDLNDTSTQYPLIYYVYSGPNTNTVYDTFTVGYHSYITTNHNAIYMIADGRGAGLNGQDILYSLNNRLGTVEIEDHLVILRQVLDRYPAIDRDRIGIWGHSYGGYATLLTLIKDEEHLFRCGVASALVTSWIYYNTMYTERYMGLPTEEDNLSGYENGDITLLAEKLRGHDFFIIHGNADDNVHYQNAAKLLRALQQLDIPFRQMSYPDEAHSLAGVNWHRYDVMNRYWQQCLNIP